MRAATSRLGQSTRVQSRNPVGFPMVLFLPLQKRFKLRLVPRHTGCLMAANQLQHMTVVIRNDLLEIREPLIKVLEDRAALFRAGKRDMTPQKFAETGNVLLLHDRLNGDKLLVDTQIELMLRIQHIGDAARIPAAKFRPVWPSTTTVPPSYTRSRGRRHLPRRRPHRNCARRIARPQCRK